MYKTVCMKHAPKRGLSGCSPHGKKIKKRGFLSTISNLYTIYQPFSRNQAVKSVEDKYSGTPKNKVRSSDVSDEIKQEYYTFCFKERESHGTCSYICV